MTNDNIDLLTQAYDETLTKQTAACRGYHHEFDIDLETFADMQEALTQLVVEKGYKLGKPDSAWPACSDPTWQGVYKPIAPAPPTHEQQSGSKTA
jgi:hypothetical protein